MSTELLTNIVIYLIYLLQYCSTVYQFIYQNISIVLKTIK